MFLENKLNDVSLLLVLTTYNKQPQLTQQNTVMFQIKAAFWVTRNLKTGLNLENFPG